MKNRYEIRDDHIVVFVACKGDVKEVFIDKDDLKTIDRFNGTWFAKSDQCNMYAAMSVGRKGKQKTIRMHRIIANCNENKLHIDHINHNGLDNRKTNIRMCTPAQNMKNMTSDRGTSKYKGVSWRECYHKWVAQIGVDNKKVHIGHYSDEKEAAIAYNEAAKKYFGEFALLNVI